MENISSSISQGSDNPTSPYQSKWLQTTLADLDNKVEAMIKLTEESSDSVADRVEMYYSKRPKLRQLVEQFRWSYRSLAEKHDKLRSESIHVPSSGSTSSTFTSREMQQEKRVAQSFKDSTMEALKYRHPFIHSNPDKHSISAHKSLNELADDLMPTELCNMSLEMKMDIRNDTRGEKTRVCDENDPIRKTNGSKLGDNKVGHLAEGSFEWENAWSETKCKVTELMEENLQLQEELIRRNKRNRDIIKELRFRLHRSMGENRRVKHNVKHKQSQRSKLNGVILGKLCGRFSRICQSTD